MAEIPKQLFYFNAQEWIELRRAENVRNTLVTVDVTPNFALDALKTVLEEDVLTQTGLPPHFYSPGVRTLGTYYSDYSDRGTGSIAIAQRQWIDARYSYLFPATNILIHGPVSTLAWNDYWLQRKILETEEHKLGMHLAESILDQFKKDDIPVADLAVVVLLSYDDVLSTWPGQSDRDHLPNWFPTTEKINLLNHLLKKAYYKLKKHFSQSILIDNDKAATQKFGVGETFQIIGDATQKTIQKRVSDEYLRRLQGSEESQQPANTETTDPE